MPRKWKQPPPVGAPRQRVGQLIDKHGHVLSKSVLTNWSARMPQIMGVRRVDDGGEP